jgi:hypothetical protein
VTGHIRNIDEANAKKREFEEAQKQKTDPPPQPTTIGSESFPERDDQQDLSQAE